MSEVQHFEVKAQAPPGSFPDAAEDRTRGPLGTFFDLNTLLPELGDFAHSTILNERIIIETKAQLISLSIVESYKKLTGGDPADIRLWESMSSYVAFAQLLLEGRSEDPDIDVALEIIDEGLEPYVSVSPVCIAKSIRKREIQYDNIMQTVILATKLWTLDRFDLRDELSTKYFEQLQQKYE